MTAPQESNKTLAALRQVLRVSAGLLILSLLTSALLLPLSFTLGLLAGGAFALGNLGLLAWLAGRWTRQGASNRSKAAIAAVLLGKLWVAVLLLFLIARYLPVDTLGLMVGMGIAVLGLLAGAMIEGRPRRVEEGSSDA